jgi:hypothetical protein
MDNVTDKTPVPQEQKKQGFGARAAVAAAFAYVGAKVGFIGTAIDAKNVLKNAPATSGVKTSAWKKIQEAITKNTEEILTKNPGTSEALASAKSYAKLSKWTLITSGIGVAVGAVIGWVRGNRIKRAKDILFHPIQSAKLIFGPAPKPAEQQDSPEPVQVATNTPEKPPVQKDWQASVSQPAADVAVGR